MYTTVHTQSCIWTAPDMIADDLVASSGCLSPQGH